MRGLSPHAVHTARAIAVAVMRLLAAWMVFRAVYLIIQRFAFALAIRRPDAAFLVYGDNGENHFIAVGIALLCIALPLWVLAPIIARRAIPAPDTGCPRCAHDTSTPDDATRCQECGLPGARPQPSNQPR